MPSLYKLLQVVLQHTTLLSSMAFLYMISTVQALIPCGQFSAHLSWLMKLRLILNTLKDLVDRLLKSHINALGLLHQI